MALFGCSVQREGKDWELWLAVLVVAVHIAGGMALANELSNGPHPTLREAISTSRRLESPMLPKLEALKAAPRTAHGRATPPRT